MKSKTSFFHKGLAANLLKRCWPVWLGYLALMVFQFPAGAYSNIQTWRGMPSDFPNYLTQIILNSGCTSAAISFFACMVVVMAVFGYLYNMRTCGMISAFPVRRETVFCTYAFTGLVPLLLADCLAALLAVVLFGDVAPSGLIGKWLSMTVMANIAFYGFSVFCAMLTGSLLILPLVYAVLNFTAYVVENCLHALLGTFLYGYSSNGSSFSLLSPGEEILFHLGTQYSQERAEAGLSPYFIFNESSLTVYCIAGAVFLVLSLLLYRKRRMESAGDTVAIPMLKPVFKYCMAFGTALVLSSFITGELFDHVLHSAPAAFAAAALLLVGAFIGYYAAEMLIQKTMHVFSARTHGLLIVWAVLLAFSVCCERDVFGYELHLPEPSEVEAVTVSVYSDSRMREAQNIADTVSLHREIISHREEQEEKLDTSYGTNVNFTYTLKNGKTLRRSYRLASGKEELETQGDLWQVQQLVNRPEAILSRNRPKEEITPEMTGRGSVYTQWYAENSTYPLQKELVLSANQVYDLYVNGILPDLEEGRIGREYYFDEADRPRSDTSVSLEFAVSPQTLPNGTVRYVPTREFFNSYFSVDLDSTHTIAWLRDNTGLEVLPFTERNEHG